MLFFDTTNLWSTYRFYPSSPRQSSPVYLFTTALGQQGQGFDCGRGMSEAETNMKEGGRIPAPNGSEQIELTGLWWDIFGCSADRQHLYNTGSLSLDFCTIRLDLAPASLDAYGEKPAISATHAVNEAEHVLRGSIQLKAPIMFSPQDTFRISFSYDPLNHRFRDECFLRCFMQIRYPRLVEIKRGT